VSNYDDDNKIALWVNDKGDNPKRPDFTGKGMHNGVPVRVSLWKRERKRDIDPVLSGTIEATDKDNRPQKPRYDRAGDPIENKLSKDPFGF
jgi:hypothetical protein